MILKAIMQRNSPMNIAKAWEGGTNRQNRVMFRGWGSHRNRSQGDFTVQIPLIHVHLCPIFSPMTIAPGRKDDRKDVHLQSFQGMHWHLLPHYVCSNQPQKHTWYQHTYTHTNTEVHVGLNERWGCEKENLFTNCNKRCDYFKYTWWRWCWWYPSGASSPRGTNDRASWLRWEEWKRTGKRGAQLQQQYGGHA